MTRLPERFLEDRALRDAARDVLIADFDHARRALTRKGVATRVADRISGGAKEVFDSAIEHAEDNRGIIAALVALIVAWFAREPLLGLFGLGDADAAEDGPEDDADAADPAPPATPGDPATEPPEDISRSA